MAAEAFVCDDWYADDGIRAIGGGIHSSSLLPIDNDVDNFAYIACFHGDDEAQRDGVE